MKISGLKTILPKYILKNPQMFGNTRLMDYGLLLLLHWNFLYIHSFLPQTENRPIICLISQDNRENKIINNCIIVNNFNVDNNVE